MGPLLDDLAALHHSDDMGSADSGQPMGDDDCGAALHELLKGIGHELLALRVESAGGLVQEKHRRVLQDSPGNSNALLLAAREVCATLSHERFESFGQAADELCSIGECGSILNLFVGRVGAPELDVLPHGHGKERRFLTDQREIVPDPFQREFPDVHAVDTHRAARHVIKALQEPHNGRLAAPALSHKGGYLARLDRQIELLQDRHFRAAGIDKADVFQLNGSVHPATLWRLRAAVGVELGHAVHD
mmetsp:Transcript_10713/g.25406  ORF Transcript_10713/g.25406 Transcript_10713/m.25406 type:complete len:247 (-) Transcript_10713:3271-4011(-)